MSKIYSLVVKGEIVALLKSELGYMEFINACKEAEAIGGSKDLYTIKSIFINDFGVEELTFNGGYEVLKRKGAL